MEIQDDNVIEPIITVELTREEIIHIHYLLEMFVDRVDELRALELRFREMRRNLGGFPDKKWEQF